MSSVGNNFPYGFRDWCDQELAFYREYCQKESESQRESWEKVLNETGGALPARSNNTKKLIRNGIPREYRSQCWLYYSGALETMGMNKDLFSSICKNLSSSTYTDIIERDLMRTFPENIYFRSPDDETNGIDKVESLIPVLRKVLLAYSVYKPEIGYCQGMNFIVATYLLFMSEEEGFWMLVNLIDSILPYDNYTPSMTGINVDQDVLIVLLEQKCSNLVKHLTKIGFTVNLVSSKWLITLYLNVLPFEICMRIWDCLFYEGTKVLFRFAIAIFMTLEKDLLKISDSGDAFQFIRDSCGKMYNCEKLFDIAFNKIGSFPAAKIQHTRNKSRIELLNKKLSQ